MKVSLLFAAQDASAGFLSSSVNHFIRYLNNVKDARTPVAVAAIRMACREKTTPIGCRNLVTPSLDEFLEKARPDNPGVSDTDLSGYWLEEYSSKRKSEFRKCVSDCEASSWWERTFGDCKFC